MSKTLDYQHRTLVDGNRILVLSTESLKYFGQIFRGNDRGGMLSLE